MAWLTDWSYRKTITLSRASGAVTNYQMKLLVGESSGATGENVDCGGHCAADFDDIRFTTSDGETLLDYWIESVSGSTPNQLATIWVEFDSIGTGATTFYMYYGNAGAVAASSGANTFIAFDNFEWGTDEDNIDTSGGSITWSKTTAGSSTAKIDSAQSFSGTRSLRLYRDGTNSPNARFTKLVGTDYAIRWRLRKDETSTATVYHGNGTKLLYVYAYTDENIFANGIDTTKNATINVWQLYEITDINHATPKHDLWFEGSIAADNAGMLTNAGANNEIRFDNETGTSNIWIDDVIVRQWVATEPAWGSWGGEETTNWLTDYTYRKSITLSRASGAVSNYQMKLLVGESSGATGEDVDCGGHCATDFDDIRFTTSDGTTLLDYWIESISGTTPNQLATIWIEFDSIGTGATTFYMYYGNAGAAAYSNGANTFIVFDDFERGSDGDTVGGSWTEVAAHVHISTEQEYTGIAAHTRSAKFVGANPIPQANLPVTASDNISIRLRAYKENAAGFTLGHANTGGTKLVWLKWDTDETLMYLNSSAAWSSSIGTITADTWHLFEINNFVWASGTYDIWVDDAKLSSGTMPADTVGVANKLHIREREAVAGYDCWVDNVIVRNYRATAPAWGSWGSEEEESTEFTELEDAALYLAAGTRAPVRVTSAPLEIISDDPCSHNIRVTSAVLEIISTEYVVSVADDARLELSAYYQELEDALLYLQAAGAAPLEDSKLWLRAHDGTTFVDAKMYLYTQGYEYDDALMYLTVGSYEYDDAALYLSVTDAITYDNAALYLYVTDGIARSDCRMYLTAVSDVPAAVSSVYQRLTSIISEV